MIDKRLINTVGKSKKYIAGNVLCQWTALISNIVIMFAVTGLMSELYERSFVTSKILAVIAVGLIALIIRAGCAVLSSRMSYLSSRSVKSVLRKRIYGKLLRLGSGYRESVNTSEVVQVAVEGVDQLETYFGAYLPQFFYAMLAPITLFIVLAPISFYSALVLFVCVPLIPISIALVQTWAKKLLARYWGQYTALGDTFLENLQGLTTLKIYSSDGFKHDEMNEESEKFRRITMKVLTMQLNSITIMDLIAYGGAAFGVILAVKEFSAGHVDPAGCLLIILLSADFFLPMRMLGSFFHIAMNGMAASGKIFRLLELPEAEDGRLYCEDGDITFENVSYSYEGDHEVLHNLDLKFERGKFTAIVGESGSGKSTVSSILMGRNKGYEGSVRIAGTELTDLSEKSRMNHITYIGHNSYLFKGTVRKNLLMAKPDAKEDELSEVLKRVKLAEFLMSSAGIDTEIAENGSNLSGGQRQRLALARALLHDSHVYIFDEATSNIDIESENDIIAEVNKLLGKKTVIMISHRLANAANADKIYVLENGCVKESGNHEELMKTGGVYSKLLKAQQKLERYWEDEA